MNKHTVLPLLLGVSQQAVSPLPLLTGTSMFPLYPTHVTPSGTDVSANVIQAAYSLNASYITGPYRGYRNGQTVFLTQSLQAAAAGGQLLKTAVDSGTRSFYQTTTTQLGLLGTSSNTTTAGQYWAVCLKSYVALYTTCYNGVGHNTSGPASNSIANRIVVQAGTTTGLSVGGGTSSVFTWHEDLLLASMFHAVWPSTTAVSTAEKWCSPFKNTVETTTSPVDVTVTANIGFYGRSKCTWQYNPVKGSDPDGTHGLGLKLTKAEYVMFLFHWVEWATTAGLGTGGILSGTSAADFHIGAYPATDGVFINPAKILTDASGGWTASSLAWALTDDDPLVRVPGSIGDAIYYPRQEGPFKTEQTIGVDQGFIDTIYTQWKAKNTDFENLKATFETTKTTFNTKVAEEKKRQEDFISNLFSPAIVVPTRPCAPTVTMTYSGPALKLNNPFETTPIVWSTITSGTDKTAFLSYSAGSQVPATSGAQATRRGYIAATADDTGTTVSNVGHIMGRLGEGQKNYYDQSKPFFWGSPVSTNTPGMQISLFPNVDTDTGLTAAQVVTIDAKAFVWETLTNFDAPAAPTAAVEADANAFKLMASSLAISLAVASSLY